MTFSLPSASLDLKVPNYCSRRKFCHLKTNHQHVNEGGIAHTVLYSEASFNYDVPSHVVNPLPDPFFGVVALRATSPLFPTQAWPTVT